MKKKLSEKEITAIIEKLRRQYDEYAERYGKKYFNRDAFEKRYLQALKDKVSLQVFVFAEVMAFEDMKKKFEQEKEEERIRREKPFTRKVERLIQEMENRYKKYPRLFEHTDISDEAQYLCGAIEEFYNNYWLNLSKIIEKDNIAQLKQYDSITEKFRNFVPLSQARLPYEIEIYVLNIGKYGIESANMLFLKQSAMFLKEIKIFLDSIEIKGKDEAIEFLDYGELKKIDVLETIKQKLAQIIADFRFKEFV